MLTDDEIKLLLSDTTAAFRGLLATRLPQFVRMTESPFQTRPSDEMVHAGFLMSVFNEVLGQHDFATGEEALAFTTRMSEAVQACRTEAAAEIHRLRTHG